nr:MAG TPA: hypothetical protein [Caudoviricetes sp.]
MLLDGDYDRYHIIINISIYTQMEKTRSIGLKKAYFGEVNPTGGMPEEMAQLARTFKGSASFTTEADSVVDIYCEEEPAAPVESVVSEPGLKQIKLNLLEWDDEVLVKIFGGTIDTVAEDVTIEGVTYSVKKYKAPRELVTINMAARVVSDYNVVIEIPNAQVTARFQWNLARTDIAQIEITAKALDPIGEKDGPYSVYKLGKPKAGA